MDLLAKKITAEFVEDKKLLGLVATGKLGKVAVTLLKPTTYVNKSGEAVKAAKLKLKVKNDQVLILHDDLDVPFGKVKYAPASGAGGHKGIRSIQLQLKSEAIP
ncbi:MAG: Peptidyl-tRNA hydrolase, partial [Parcubacteria group bacterium GW2011_GWB1_48_6]